MTLSWYSYLPKRALQDFDFSLQRQNGDSTRSTAFFKRGNGGFNWKQHGWASIRTERKRGTVRERKFGTVWERKRGTV